MRLITIVTGLPPRIDGIGDYALTLARQVKIDIGVETDFIVGDPAWDGPSSVEGFEVSKSKERSPADLLLRLKDRAESDSIVLLHYGGYGYAARGCPLWLVDGLRRWRKEKKDRLLITMFHELYASGPPWTSSFWLSPLQKNLVARLARLSDQYLTSRRHYAEMVCKWSLGKHSEARSLPVFSSIGEPQSLTPLIERSRRLVVFGNTGRRALVYRRSAQCLNRICDELGIEEILDIGRPVDFDPSRTVRIPVKVCGELSRLEVSKALSDAIAGVLDYPSEVLGKSTVFAAFCAHRMAPIIATYGKAAPEDGLEAGTHYWLSDAQPQSLNLQSGQVIADNAHAWYRSHTISIHAKTLAAYLSANICAADGNTTSARI